MLWKRRSRPGRAGPRAVTGHGCVERRGLTEGISTEDSAPAGELATGLVTEIGLPEPSMLILTRTLVSSFSPWLTNFTVNTGLNR